MAYDHMTLVRTCFHQCETAKLFIVRNTAEKPLFVVAKDFACARWIAMTSDHIRSVGNGKVFGVRDDWLAKDDPFRSALRRAVAGGSPGPITRVGDSAVIIANLNAGIKGRVYPPLSTAA